MEEEIVNRFLEWVREDSPYGDITTETIIPRETVVEAYIVAREEGVAACIDDLSLVLEKLGIRVEKIVSDGEFFGRDKVLLRLCGSAWKILLYERTLLNILSHCMGVATLTRKYVDIVRKHNPRIKIAATRKILPGLRYFVKKAVIAGGGDPHRFSLSDMVLIKDNHLKILRDIGKAVEKARIRTSFSKKIEVEAGSVEEAVKAVEAGADIVMLDNFTPDMVGEVLDILREKGLRDHVLIEVSGGVNLDNIYEYLKHDIDIISIGRITNSAPAIDLSLEINKVVEKCV